MRGLFLSLDFYTILFNTIFFSLIMISFNINFYSKNLINLLRFLKNLENSIPLEKINNIKFIIILNFLLIFFVNFFSLFPHIFSLFSIFNFTLVLRIIFWSSMILTNFIYFLKNFLIHLTPISTPIILISFIVLIEIVRQFIRPLTLIVRLGTNLTTGHLILGLISFFRIYRIFIQIPFFLLELIVALVQAYVFSLLVVLYFNE